MELYLLRHAIAVPHGAPGVEKDSERVLTPEGKRKMRLVAEGMRALKLSFDIIFSSPFPRARQTADIVGKAFEARKKIVLTDSLAVGGEARELIDVVGRRYSGLDCILLVGHEPYLSELISVLLTGETNASVTLKKGGLCKLTVDTLRYGRCATLEWLLTPSQLIRMGQRS